MDLNQLHCDEILGKILTGITVEELAEEYGVSTGIIEIIRVGKLHLADGGMQREIPRQKVTSSNSPIKLKCTPEEIDEICERYKFGDSLTSLAHDFSVSVTTIQRYTDLRKIVRGVFSRDSPTGTKKILHDFLSKVRKCLWRIEKGNNHPTYKAWEAEIQRLWQTGKYSKDESMVLATRKFAVCRPLFGEYDVSEYDPEAKAKSVPPTNTNERDVTNEENVPGSTPESKKEPIPEGGKPPPLDSNAPIKCENKEQTHRENLAWAVKAAGYRQRTNIPPDTCPNDAAYWLYQQAVNEPREFLTKVNAMEMKTMVVDNSEVERRGALRSINDLDNMLKELTIE